MLHRLEPMRDFTLNRRRLAEAIHFALAAASLWAAFLLRFEFRLDPFYRTMLWTALPLLLAIKLVVFRIWGLQDLAWRYTGFRDLLRIAASTFVGSLAAGLAVRLAQGPAFPRSIPILDFVLSLALFSGAHAFAKVLYERRSRGSRTTAKRVAVYGAGKAGWTLVSEIRGNPQIGYEVVGFFDDDPAKLGLSFTGSQGAGRPARPGSAR